MRKQLTVVAAAIALLLIATPALAHVSVDGTETAKGAEASTLTFRVPNEEDDASTTQVEIFLPTGVTFEFVATQPVAGWTVTADKTKATWSGGTIGPGQFQEFKLEVGPLPDDADSLTFKAIQTYSNGDIVRWIDLPKSDGSEPEHPAPALALTAATDDDHHGAAAETSDAPTKDDVDQARVLAITGIVMALLAGVVALSARRAKGANASE